MSVKKQILVILLIFFSYLLLGQTKEVITASLFKSDSLNNITIFTVVEEMPEFPGGQDSLMKFLLNNLKWPNEADCMGSVYISFIVEADGTLSHKGILRGICDPFDKEALRVINLIPQWKPGKQNGIAVPVKFVMPIKFALK